MWRPHSSRQSVFHSTADYRAYVEEAPRAASRSTRSGSRSGRTTTSSRSAGGCACARAASSRTRACTGSTACATARSTGPPPRPTSAPARRRRAARARQRGVHRDARHGGRGLTALVDDVRSACARVAERAEHVRVVEAAIEPYARTLPPESPPAPDLDGRVARGARRLLADAQRDQLRLGLVPDAAQAGRAVGLPHGRGGPARPRAVDGERAHRDRDAGGRRRPSGRTRRTS